MPPWPLRELWDLTRPRARLASGQARLANRIHKVLEDANLKLGAVAADILGKSGRAMLRALIGGEHDPWKPADLAERRLRAKIPELGVAPEGHFTEQHRVLVGHPLGHLDDLEAKVEEISARVAERLRALLPAARLRWLDAIPGANRTTIEDVMAEIGVEMSVYPDEGHLSSRAGICPGDEESAGKRLRSRRTRKDR